MSGRRLIAAAPLLLAALLVACGPDNPDGPNDGGLDDAGTSDAGPADAGCDEPECTPCEDGGLLCAEGFECDETTARCRVPCLPGATRCEGLLESTCAEDGFTWSEAERCEGEGLCRDGACLPVTECRDEVPACCSLASHCGLTSQSRNCPECRPTSREAYCLAGACDPVPTEEIATFFLGDASLMQPDDRIQTKSGIVTLYRGVAADGRAVECEWLLGDDGDGSPHDLKDGALNATVSKTSNFSGTGNDVFTLLVNSVKIGENQTVVYSVYDGFNAEGTLVGRGCRHGIDPTADGGQIVVDLFSIE